jgi:hypothetical protein
VFYHWTLLISGSMLLFFFLPATVVVLIAMIWTALAITHTLWPIIERRMKRQTLNSGKAN